MSDSLLEALVEEHLGSVVFAMDYLQLDFDAARFTAYVWPMTTIGDAAIQFGDPRYRDALCAFITHEVTSVEESPEAGLVIRFGLGEIGTNPAATDLGGPEIAQLQIHKGHFETPHGRSGDQEKTSSLVATGPDCNILNSARPRAGAPPHLHQVSRRADHGTTA